MIQSTTFRDLLVVLSVALPTYGTPVLKDHQLPEHTDILTRDVDPFYCNPSLFDPAVPRLDCPKKIALDQDGTCMSGMPESPNAETECNRYCEESIQLVPGREQLYGVECRPGTSTPACTISKGASLTRTTGMTIDVKLDGKLAPKDKPLQAGFSIGASWKWETAITTSVTETYSHQLNASIGSCGYFTFVPYLVKSCGTLSSAPIRESYVSSGSTGISTGGRYVRECRKDQAVTQKNWCNTITVYNNDIGVGNPGVTGVTLFVYKDCDTSVPLSKGQDRRYCAPGVSAYPGFMCEDTRNDILGQLRGPRPAKGTANEGSD